MRALLQPSKDKLLGVLPKKECFFIYNKYAKHKIMKEIKLSRGLTTKVDDCVYDALMQHGWKWYANSYGYAVTKISYRSKGKRQYATIFLHRWILDSFYNVRLGALEVDHINGDKLDNCRENLRAATRQQNSCNRKAQKNSISGFKGVSFESKNQKWLTRISKDGKAINLGRFDLQEDAILAYDSAAEKMHGNFARTNF